MDAVPPTSPSRPGSRAMSEASFATATERAHSPHSPRALAHEIEHIKHLISRAQHQPAATGSITAQVFQRNRSSSQEPVSQARIFHELDVLKRRVRHKRDQSGDVSRGGSGQGLGLLVRRDSQVDPGAETETETDRESDGAASLDEREEELEWARGEVERVKQEREEWLEDAERRVDVLISEKENLNGRVEAGKKETDKARAALKEAEGKIEDLRAQVEEVRRELEGERKEKEELAASCRDAQTMVHNLTVEKEEMNQKLEELQKSLQEVRHQVDTLNTSNESSARSLEEANAKISALEEVGRASDDHVQRLISEHKDRNDESDRRYNELQKQHEKLQEEGHVSAGKLAELQKAAQEHEADRKQWIGQVEEQKGLVGNSKVEVERLTKEVEVARKAVEALKEEREELKNKLDETTAARDEGETGLQSAQKEKDELQQRLDSALRDAEEHKTLRADMDRLKTDFDGVSQERDEHKRSLNGVSAERDELARTTEEKQNVLREEHAKKEATLQGDIEDLQSKHANEIAALKAERDRFAADADAGQKQALEDAEQKVESLKEEQKAALAEMRSANDEEVKKVREDSEAAAAKIKAEHDEALEAAQSELRDANEVHDKDLAEMKSAHDAEMSTLREQHEGQSRELQQSHQAATDDQHSQHERALEAGRTELSTARQEHDKAIDELRQSHESALDQQRSQHKQDLEDVRRQMSEADTAHEKKVAQLDEQHQNATTALRDELGQTKKALSAAITNAESERSKHQGDLEDATRQLSDAKNAHETKLSDVGRAHEDAISALRGELIQAQESLASAKQTSERDIADLKAEHEVTIAGIRARHDSALQAVRNELADAQNSLSTNKTNSDAEVERLKAEHECQVKELDAGWSSKAEQATREHQADLQRAADDAERAAVAAREDFQQRLAGRDADATVAVKEKEALEKMNAEQESELAALRAELQRSSEQSKTENDKALTRVRKEHDEATAQAEVDFESRLSQMQIEHEDAFTKAKAEHLLELNGARSEHEKSMEQAKQDHGALVTGLESKRDELQRAMDQLKGDHETAVSDLRIAKDRMATEHSRAIADIETQLHQSRSEHQAEIVKIQDAHAQSLDELRNDPSLKEQQGEMESLQAQLDKLKAEQKMVMSEKDAELGSQISSLRYEHSKALSEVQSQHSSALQEQRNASETEIAALKHSHEEALARSKSEARRDADQRIARLEEQHEASLTAALAHADDDMDERLRTQAKAHGEEIEQIHTSLNDELHHLQTQLEEASELRHTQMEAADAQNKGALAELGDKLKTAEQASAELASKHITVMAELSALQARLDAESTGHAEAERALAQMRKQKIEEGKKTSDSSDELMQQVLALQVERDALKKQLEDSSARASAGATTRDIPMTDGANESGAAGDDDVATLRSQLAAMKLETRRQADEFARQNEFLVKELESMRMHANTPGASPNQQTDAFVQTEPEPKSRPSTRDRIVIPANLPTQVNGASSRPSTARSFEDYLQQAKAELSELGSVISANEALFAQKIQEHVGSLQLAKDQLAAEYKDKFDALLQDKERMDKDVHSKSAEEFARERQQLAATYGVERQEHEAQLPSPQKKAFRNAEEQLVKEYNRRIAKKKSKIALKHAERFQNLTKDYDQQIAELMTNKEKLEGDLSVDPTKFETDYDEMDVRSSQLEVQRKRHSVSYTNGDTLEDAAIGTAITREPVSPAPAAPAEVTSTPDTSASAKSDRRRSALPRLSSTPRTPTSIPRAVPFPGNRDSPDATSQPMTPRQPYDPQRSASERYPPVAQRSLMRAKFPVEGHGDVRRSATNPASPGGEREREKEAPVSKIKKRQLRHSSGMHFGNWREQYQG